MQVICTCVETSREEQSKTKGRGLDCIFSIFRDSEEQESCKKHRRSIEIDISEMGTRWRNRLGRQVFKPGVGSFPTEDETLATTRKQYPNS